MILKVMVEQAGLVTALRIVDPFTKGDSSRVLRTPCFSTGAEFWHDRPDLKVLGAAWPSHEGFHRAADRAPLRSHPKLHQRHQDTHGE